jgi:HSP20 family protein
MNALTQNETGKWNPFKEMELLQNRLASLFDPSVERMPVTGEKGAGSRNAPEWAPPVDIAEDDKEYTIKAELPDIQKEDVAVTLENGVLMLRGERKFEKEDKGKRYHRIERAYGSFLRSFVMPEDADESKVSAEFKDGMLKVHVAKSEKAKPKTVDIKIG